MTTAGTRALIRDIGAEFKLELLHYDDSGVNIDYSSGWACRFVLMTGFGTTKTDIIDTSTVSLATGSTITLTDGSSGINIAVAVEKTITEAWPITNSARYELQVWPTASPEAVRVLIKGEITLREGLI